MRFLKCHGRKFPPVALTSHIAVYIHINKLGIEVSAETSEFQRFHTGFSKELGTDPKQSPEISNRQNLA